MNLAKPDIPRTENRWPRWSLALGILIWFTDLNAIYALPSLACQWGWFSFTIAGIPGLVIVEAIVSLICLLLILLMIYIPWRTWRRRRAEEPAGSRRIQEAEQDRPSLMAFVSMLVNSFFFLFIVATFVPMIALNACARG